MAQMLLTWYRLLDGVTQASPSDMFVFAGAPLKMRRGQLYWWVGAQEQACESLYDTAMLSPQEVCRSCHIVSIHEAIPTLSMSERRRLRWRDDRTQRLDHRLVDDRKKLRVHDLPMPY